MYPQKVLQGVPNRKRTIKLIVFNFDNDLMSIPAYPPSAAELAQQLFWRSLNSLASATYNHPSQ